MPQFYRYSDPLNPLKSVAATAWNGAVLIGAWYDGVSFVYGGGAIALGELAGSGIFGYAGAGTDSSGTATLVRYQAELDRLTALGFATGFPAPSGAVQANLFDALTIGPSDIPYMTDVSGNIFSFFGSGLVSGSVSQIGAFGQPTRGLVVAGGSTLYAMAPASGHLISAPIGSIAATGLINTPFATPACIAASGNLIAVGGWGSSSIASGFNIIAPHPTNPNLFVAATSGALGLTNWQQNVSGVWIETQSLVNTLNPTALAWTPLGNTLLATNQTSGSLDIYGLSVGVLTFDQTIAVSGATALSIAGGSVNGLVCQPVLNQVISIYAVGSGWAVSGTAAIGSPQCVVASPDGDHAWVGSVSGISNMQLFGNLWELQSTNAIGFAPKYIGYDGSNSGIYAAGVSGASGLIYSSVGPVSGSFVGGVSGLIAMNGQILVLDPTGAVRSFNPDTAAQNYSIAIASGALCFGLVGAELLIGYPTDTLQFEFGAPGTLQTVNIGQVGIYNTSTSGWTTTSLGPNFTPAALTFDPSGNITVAAIQNFIFNIAASGGIMSSKAVSVFSGQVANTLLGISSLNWINGHLYGTSSMNESFIDLTDVA